METFSNSARKKNHLLPWECMAVYGSGGGNRGDWPYQRVIALTYTGGEANLWDETFSLNISSYSIFYSPAVGGGAYLGML